MNHGSGPQGPERQGQNCLEATRRGTEQRVRSQPPPHPLPCFCLLSCTPRQMGPLCLYPAVGKFQAEASGLWKAPGCPEREPRTRPSPEWGVARDAP